MNNSRPLDVAAVLAVASVQAIRQLARLLLVHAVALVITLSGWRPEPSADVPPRPRPSAPTSHTVLELRTLARQTLGSSATVGGRRIAQARKSDLLLALQLSSA